MKARIPFWLVVLLLLLMLGVLSDFLGLSIGLRIFEQTHREATQTVEDSQRAAIRGCRDAELDPRASRQEREQAGRRCDMLEEAYRKKYGRSP